MPEPTYEQLLIRVEEAEAENEVLRNELLAMKSDLEHTIERATAGANTYINQLHFRYHVPESEQKSFG
jgi:hypothetical protein